MTTTTYTVDAENPNADTICRAADVIRSGGTVAFPTETVYGLGANALSAPAVRKIFEAKGRPATNPLIVHIADVHEVLNVATDFPETAAKLAGRFWPGPLTLILPRNSAVPDEVTAGGPTVAVRWPAHHVATALIRAAGVPLAAPSANRSNALSPTRAEHVAHGLAGRIDMILDGGACRGGIESTVVDVTRLVPRVLRPGLVTAPMLEAVIGSVEVGGATDEVTRSPGQQERHYAPRARLILVPPAQLLDTILDFERMHTRFAVVTFGPTVERWKGQHPVFEYLDCVNLTSDAVQAAEKLYQTLHTLDEPLIDCILVEEPPDTPEWAGVRDRVKRGAH